MLKIQKSLNALFSFSLCIYSTSEWGWVGDVQGGRGGGGGGVERSSLFISKLPDQGLDCLLQ